MNKRIQEIAEQAGAKFPFGGFVNYDQFDCEKFAELIIKECAGLVQGVPTDSMGYHSADQKIKQHFGVE